MIRIADVTKEYRLGQIGTGTLQGDLKEWLQKDRENTAPKHKRIRALDHVNLTICRGEALGIIGRNGAGKSTLLKLISRITAPTEGEIDIYGRITSMLEVGTGFDRELTGRENVYLNGAILGMSKAEITAKMDEIIAFSEVEKFIDTPVKRYSSGMFVKLGFAVAAHLDSEIMIMDEVLAVGDMAFQHKCLDKMSRTVQKEGKTILYVSHNMNTIRRLCGRCIVLDEGRVIYDGDPEKAIAVYLGADREAGTEFVFNENNRPYDSIIRMNKRFELVKLRILHEKPVFMTGEKMHLEITWFAFMKLTGIRFRLEFWSQTGEKIGTMLSSGTIDAPLERGTFKLTADLSHLAPGHYRADLVAYKTDSDGNEDILDGVYPGVILEVLQPVWSADDPFWVHRYWGHVRLHDLTVESK